MTNLEKIPARRKSRTVPSFLKKTYEILEDQQNHYVVKWSINGIGFVVIKEEDFSKQILPKYFKHSNYSSFVRQLNMYNFHKIREANNESHFHHQNFRRSNKQKKYNMRDLLSEIHRKPEKKKRKHCQNNQEQNSEIQLNNSIIKGSYSLKSVLSQEQIGQPQIGKMNEKKIMHNTRHACVSEKQQIEIEGNKYNKQNLSKERVSIQNLLPQQNQEDKVSINNELVEIFPHYPTNEIFCPSNHNIYPFPYQGTISNFNIFY